VKGNAPQTLKSTIETQKLITKLRARGLPAQSSTNAGRYLCNALLFASLYQGRKRALHRQTGFIHIPRLNTHGINKDALLKAVKISLNHCVSQHIHKMLMREETGG
jgi:pyroglutamyl-peptidase